MLAQSFILLLFALFPAAFGQIVYLAGDSTMAKGGGGSGTNGWGEFLGQYLILPVVNRAVAGTSARSYTDQGRFATLIDIVNTGDIVVLEFGHNDGTSRNFDNGRSDAVGSAYDATKIVTEANGTEIVIHSYPYYIQNAVRSLKSIGAIPIVSSQTPDNIWYNNVLNPVTRFVGYAATAAAREGVLYVDHNGYVAQAYNKLGETTVKAFYPRDHVHTSPAGAEVVARAFVAGLLCGSSIEMKGIVNGNALRGQPFLC